MAGSLGCTISSQRPVRHQLFSILRSRRPERQQVRGGATSTDLHDPAWLTTLSHVRVSSKATLRIPLSSLLPRVPKLMHATIQGSRYYAAKSNDIVIQADDSRKQSDNVNACFRKLHELIVQAGKAHVPAETSPEQLTRIEALQKAEAAGRRKMKEFRSNKKSARRGGGRGDE